MVYLIFGLHCWASLPSWQYMQSWKSALLKVVWAQLLNPKASPRTSQFTFPQRLDSRTPGHSRRGQWMAPKSWIIPAWSMLFTSHSTSHLWASVSSSTQWVYYIRVLRSRRHLYSVFMGVSTGTALMESFVTCIRHKWYICFDVAVPSLRIFLRHCCTFG